MKILTVSILRCLNQIEIMEMKTKQFMYVYNLKPQQPFYRQGARSLLCIRAINPNKVILRTKFQVTTCLRTRLRLPIQGTSAIRIQNIYLINLLKKQLKNIKNL